MISTVKIASSGAIVRMIVFSTGVMILGSSVLCCMRNTADEGVGERNMPEKTIEDVQQEHTEEWMSIPGVVGTAIGEFEGKPCIRVFVAEKTKEVMEKVPSEIEGFRVIIDETGEIRARGVD